jgi:hypothetical protein
MLVADVETRPRIAAEVVERRWIVYGATEPHTVLAVSDEVGLEPAFSDR